MNFILRRSFYLIQTHLSVVPADLDLINSISYSSSRTNHYSSWGYIIKSIMLIFHNKYEMNVHQIFLVHKPYKKDQTPGKQGLNFYSFHIG